jgi:hypothetical protein
MSTPNPSFPTISTGFTWVDPIANVDPTQPFTAAELSGYQIGVRADGTGSPGTYTVNAAISDPAATSEALTALGTVLAPGNYWAAIKATGAAGVANDSAFSQEIGFSIAAPPIPTPNPPSSFAAA